MNFDYSPVLNEAGQPAGVIAIVIETTQRVIAERTLKDRENDLASVQRIARIGGVTVDLGNDFGSGQRSLAYQEIHGLIRTWSIRTTTGSSEFIPTTASGHSIIF